jgi:hypothetical protein
MQPVTPPARPGSPDETQPSFKVRRLRTRETWPWWSSASLVLLVLVGLACIGGTVAFATRTPPATTWPTAVFITVTPRPGPTYVVVTSAAPTPAAGPGTARTVRVAGTQGLSLRIRIAPSAQAETIKLVPDGTQLLITGEGMQAEGALWWPVRDPSDNKEGWAVSTYLIP